MRSLRHGGGCWSSLESKCALVSIVGFAVTSRLSHTRDRQLLVRCHGTGTSCIFDESRRSTRARPFHMSTREERRATIPCSRLLTSPRRETKRCLALPKTGLTRLTCRFCEQSSFLRDRLSFLGSEPLCYSMR